MTENKDIRKRKKRHESRRVKDIGESTFENIDERDEEYLNNDNSKKISSEENNVSSSVDIDKLKIKKKGKKGKKKKAKDKQQEEMDKALIQMEKSNKEKMLEGELADMMEEIELENKDFKKKVFFSNFHDLNNHLGIFDEVQDTIKPELNYEGLKDKNITPYGLINKYTEKAEHLKKNKKKK